MLRRAPDAFLVHGVHDEVAGFGYQVADLQGGKSVNAYRANLDNYGGFCMGFSKPRPVVMKTFLAVERAGGMGRWRGRWHGGWSGSSGEIHDRIF